jgi:hypothetical protein
MFILDFFQQMDPLLFGGTYLGFSLTKSHEIIISECAQRWGTMSF